MVQKSIIALCVVGVLSRTLPVYAEITEVLDRRVHIVNKSIRTVVRLYASNVDKSKWGRNLLGAGGTIGPNMYRTFNFDDGWGYCRFDFKAVMDTSAIVIGERINVCETTAWTIYDK